MSVSEDAARADLRTRQGVGARYDSPGAPAPDLLLARRGTAYFARKLNELNDSELYLPSAIAGLSRAQIVANISYEARSLALANDALVQSGTPPCKPLLINEFAATLPARALRHLFRHSEVHLSVCWRDLTDEEWGMQITLPDGTQHEARALPRLRARSIWQAAVNLGTGAYAREVADQASIR